MSRCWWRFWPIVALSVCLTLAGAVHLGVDWWTREPPNFDRI
jgi:hypothetical protein